MRLLYPISTFTLGKNTIPENTMYTLVNALNHITLMLIAIPKAINNTLINRTLICRRLILFFVSFFMSHNISSLNCLKKGVLCKN